MAQAINLIGDSLGLLGVRALGEPVDGDVAADAFRALNNLLESWQLDRLFILSTSDVTKTVAPGTASLTIGSGGDIDIARPVRLESRAYFRFTNIDIPMEQVGFERWNEITLKSLSTTYPGYYYYESTYPLGRVHFWPVPISSCELHLTLQNQLTAFADLNTNYALPPGYARLITLGLAVELSPNYRPASPDLLRQYQNAARLVRRMNARIPVLEAPPWVQRGNDRRPNGLANFLAGI